MKYPAYKKTHRTGLPWVPVVPAHWEIKRLRFLAEGIEQGWSPQCNNFPAEGDEWGVLKVGCVNGNAFNPQENKQLPADLEPRLEYQIQLGDILISRANTRELLGSAGIVNELTANLLLCDKLYRLRVNDTIDKQFLVHYLRSKAARAHYECEATGTSGSMQNIGQDTIANLPVPLPPLDEQHIIVEFLDGRIAHLDTLLDRQQRLLRLLAEKRTALITQAVMQGLNALAPRRSSGIAWLGEVPAHWQVKRLKFLVDKVGSGKTPKGGAETYVSEGVMFLRSQNIHFEGLKLSDVAFISDDVDTEMAGSRVVPGDVLLNITGASLGRSSLFPSGLGKANVNQHVCVIRPKHSFIQSEFLWKAFSSAMMQAQIFQNEQGISRQALNFEQIGDMVIVLPPLIEQQEITNWLNERQEPLSRMTRRVNTIIKRLQEYRVALITAAVTGQIDVRAAVTAEAA